MDCVPTRIPKGCTAQNLLLGGESSQSWWRLLDHGDVLRASHDNVFFPEEDIMDRIMYGRQFLE
jgi:hypothetical protein